MIEKRKDSKGRILKDGEIERKDGRYEYRYKKEEMVRENLFMQKI